jgi:hypothetical protein
MLEIKLKMNPEYGKGERVDIPRYFFEVDLNKVVPSGGVSNIAVYWRPNPKGDSILKEIYSCEIAGTVLEKGNLLALKNVLPGFIEGLINYKTLPYYYVNIFGTRVPVYLVEKKLQLRFSDGACFSGDDVSLIYEKLVEYSIFKNYIKREEEVSLELLYWKELRLFPSGFAFVDFNEKIFIPVFYKVNGTINLNYDRIGEPSRILPLENIFDLWREIASQFINLKVIVSLYELRIENLVRELWERIEGFVRPLDSVLSFYKNGQRFVLQLFQAQTKELFAAQEGRTLRLSLASDFEDVKDRVAKELIKEKKITDISEVVLEKGR